MSVASDIETLDAIKGLLKKEADSAAGMVSSIGINEDTLEKKAATFKHEFFGNSRLAGIVSSVEISNTSNDNILEGSFATAYGEIHFKAATEVKNVATTLLTVTLNPQLRKYVSKELLRRWILFFMDRKFIAVDFKFFREGAKVFLENIISSWLKNPAELNKMMTTEGVRLSLDKLDFEKIRHESFQMPSLQEWPDIQDLKEVLASVDSDINLFMSKRAAGYVSNAQAKHLLAGNLRTASLEELERGITPQMIQSWMSKSRGNPLYAIARQINIETSLVSTNPGGIDLNAKNMNLDLTRDGQGVGMKFDPAIRSLNFNAEIFQVLSLLLFALHPFRVFCRF